MAASDEPKVAERKTKLDGQEEERQADGRPLFEVHQVGPVKFYEAAEGVDWLSLFPADPAGTEPENKLIDLPLAVEPPAPPVSVAHPSPTDPSSVPVPPRKHMEVLYPPGPKRVPRLMIALSAAAVIASGAFLYWLVKTPAAQPATTLTQAANSAPSETQDRLTLDPLAPQPARDTVSSPTPTPTPTPTTTAAASAEPTPTVTPKTAPKVTPRATSTVTPKAAQASPMRFVPTPAPRTTPPAAGRTTPPAGPPRPPPPISSPAAQTSPPPPPLTNAAVPTPTPLASASSAASVAGASTVGLPPPPASTPTPRPTSSPISTPRPTNSPASTPVPTAAANPAPRPPGPSPPPANTSAAETAAVRAALDNYRAAFESLSSESVKSVWPGANAAALSKAFKQMESQSMDFYSCGVELNGAAAEATCAGAITFVPKVGGKTPRVEPHRWSFYLTRQNDRWIIDRIVAK